MDLLHAVPHHLRVLVVRRALQQLGEALGLEPEQDVVALHHHVAHVGEVRRVAVVQHVLVEDGDRLGVRAALHAAR